MGSKPKIVVVSPCVDRQHGTERCLAEQLERLASTYEVHLYSSRVNDLNLEGIQWHRVPALRGPSLFSYLWFFAANHVLRWLDKRFRHLPAALVYSPGINCTDANVISIHIVFGELRRRLKSELRLSSNAFGQWPRVIHRKMFYSMAAVLERLVYSGGQILLVSPSERVATIIQRDFHRTGNMSVIYHGCDVQRFHPMIRNELRKSARRALGLQDNQVAVLLIGNDWRNKGLGCLIEAVTATSNMNLSVLAVGKDDPAQFQTMVEGSILRENLRFLPPRRDVEFYYAAADIYAGPSREDAFSLPPLEAMACGLPVITSRDAGVSEIITHEIDGFILEDSSDAKTLSELIAQLASDPELRNRMGGAAVRTASQYTWERNASQLVALLDEATQRLERQPDAI